VAPNMSFWEVYDADMPVLEHSSFQAILGVGPPGSPESSAWQLAVEDKQRLEAWNSATFRVPPELRKLVQAKTKQLKTLVNDSLNTALYTQSKNDSLLEVLNVTSFSVCLGKKPGSEGYFIWHDHEPERRPHLFMHVPVVGQHTWGVSLKSVYLGDADGGYLHRGMDLVGCFGGCGAILDSGTSLLVMPRAAAGRIVASLEANGAQCNDQLGVSGLPYIHFQLGKHKLSLPPEAYLGTVVGGAPTGMKSWLSKEREKVVVCGLQLAVLTQEAETQFGPMWIMGMPFFRRYYVNFERGSATESRAMNIAPAGNDCRPAGSHHAALIGARDARSIDAAGEAAPAGQEKRRFRTIDASMLQVPHWATRAFAKGLVSI